MAVSRLIGQKLGENLSCVCMCSFYPKRVLDFRKFKCNFGNLINVYIIHWPQLHESLRMECKKYFLLFSKNLYTIYCWYVRSIDFLYQKLIMNDTLKKYLILYMKTFHYFEIVVEYWYLIILNIIYHWSICTWNFPINFQQVSLNVSSTILLIRFYFPDIPANFFFHICKHFEFRYVTLTDHRKRHPSPGRKKSTPLPSIIHSRETYLFCLFVCPLDI